MYVAAALLIAAAVLRAHAHGHPTDDDVIESTLSRVFGDNASWTRRAAACARTVGPATCFSAFGAYRADHALQGTARTFDDDLKTFPWEEYANGTQETLQEKLCDSTARLLRRRSLTLSAIPGYRLELASKRSGTISVDIYKSSDEARGTLKKLRRRFLAFMPLFLIPGLLMSAILPFVLPALKMAVMGAGMLNQMALTGAVFTLLRNNAFNDKYEKKIIYVNNGYKNEKKRPIYADADVIHTHTIESNGYFADGSQDVYDYAANDPYAAEASSNVEWVTHVDDDRDGFGPVNQRNTRTYMKNHAFDDAEVWH